MDTPEEIKIWQRVRGETTPITDSLPAMTAGAIAEAALYGKLAQQSQGHRKKILLQLQEEELRHIRCLKGIYQIAAGTPMQVAAVPISAERAEIALQKSYGRALKALQFYDRHSGHAEYGAIFSCLAATERTHCCKIAELIGEIHG